jgi:YVTN family beta-propeller protein
MLSLFVVAALLVPEVAAVTHGVDQYGNLPGYFYVFNATRTQIFEPSSGKLVKSIPFGVAKYGDAVYAEDQAQLKHYLFVCQNENNKVTVIDTDTQSVLTTVNTGKMPLHIFSVYYRDEVI